MTYNSIVRGQSQSANKKNKNFGTDSPWKYILIQSKFWSQWFQRIGPIKISNRSGIAVQWNGGGGGNVTEA